MNRRPLLLCALAAASLLALRPSVAVAQPPFPSQTVKIIVATPPGGASDTAARLLAQSLSKSLGQQVVVENKPGGNGVPAVQSVLASPPDGHTLLWAMSSMAGMPLLVKGSPVKSMNEFVPVAEVVNIVYGFFINAGLPATTLAEFSAHLKANPDKLNYGTGVLSEQMVTVHYLKAIGAKALRVPYKGGAQLMPDLIRGELQFNIGPLAPGLQHVRSGKLRLLATMPERSDAAPGVPALREAGIATDSFPTWNGLVAPPGTPREVADRLAAEVHRALADAGLRSALEAQGFRVVGGTPQQFAAAIESATVSWRQFVRDNDIAPE